MASAVEMYRSQLLWGDRFLSQFKDELATLYSDNEFMNVIYEIQAKAPKLEDESTIEEIKNVAKRALFDGKIAFDYQALNAIVSAVYESGAAKNSALISVYCAMRYFELSESSKKVDTPATPMPASKSKSGSELDFRLKWPAEYRCEDGHYVRSKNEALVDNWLYSHQICHAYEKAVFAKDAQFTYCSDFYLPAYNAFIEIWGMTTPQYESRRKQKTAFYQNSGYALLQFDGDDVKNLDDKLSQALQRRGKK